MKKTLIACAALVASFAAPAKADEYCREYTQTVYIGGQAQSGYGTACLQPDGSWEKGELRTSNNVVVNQPVATPVVYESVRYVPQPVYVAPRPSLIYYGGYSRYRHHYRNGHRYGHYGNHFRGKPYARGGHYGSRNGGALTVRW